MINILLWLAYLASGAFAFILVYRMSWRLFPSMVAGTAVGLLLSLLVMLAIPREDASPWFQVELTLNGSLGLIFAGAGAALAYALREARRRD